MDRISQLPDFIVHHILSFLKTPKDLVRMSVLSKTWLHLTASFPILDFSISDFSSGESFFSYVEYTTSRFCHQNLPAHSLRLIKFLRDPADLDIVDRCLERVFRNGVKELVIYLHNYSDYSEPPSDSEESASDYEESPSATAMPRYRLPNTLLSVSVLTSLTIFGCDLPSSFMLDALKFKSLTRLKLENIHIDDEVITYLATSCPLLQVFEIRSCPGFKRFCVHGHQSLQEVDISFDAPVERIDIEAPNLYELSVADEGETGQPQMNLALCEKLTSVSCEGCPLPNDFLSNFPFVENLVLFTGYNGNNLKLSSNSLRTLVLNSDFDLEEIELSTPSLGLFIYSYNEHYSGLGISHLPHLELCMRCYLDDSIDSLWFQKLRLFLDKENGFKALNLYICTDQKLTVLEKLKAVELPPYELEHIELHFEHEESSGHATFVDAVLCCFCPRSLTLRSSFPLTTFEEQSPLVKFTYEKLLEQEFQGQTSIQIVSPYSTKAQKQFKGLMSLPRSLPRQEKAISFIKEEE
ncbi:putative leucine-rich repeat domain superfamily, F-box-like domain superfamily [Helianthus anomalus]